MSPPAGQDRQALSLLEIVMAVAAMAVLIIPLLGLMTRGFSDTQATIDEVQATNLASEILEQLDAVPFAAVPPDGGATEATLSSETGALADGAELCPGSGVFLHLTDLPADFSRELLIGAIGAHRRDATVTIRWRLKGYDRSLVMKRILVKDAILPGL